MATKKTTAAAKVEVKEAEVKETVKKAAEVKAEPVKEEVKAEVKAEAKKAPAKKAEAKKETVKKETTKRACAKKEVAPVVTVQFGGQEVSMETVIENAKKAYEAEGNKVSSIKEFQIYVKPEEYAAYYVIDGVSGKINLF